MGDVFKNIAEAVQKCIEYIPYAKFKEKLRTSVQNALEYIRRVTEGREFCVAADARGKDDVGKVLKSNTWCAALCADILQRYDFDVTLDRPILGSAKEDERCFGPAIEAGRTPQVHYLYIDDMTYSGTQLEGAFRKFIKDMSKNVEYHFHACLPFVASSACVGPEGSNCFTEIIKNLNKMNDQGFNVNVHIWNIRGHGTPVLDEDRSILSKSYLNNLVPTIQEKLLKLEAEDGRYLGVIALIEDYNKQMETITRKWKVNIKGIDLSLPFIYFDHKAADSVSLAAGTALQGYRLYNPVVGNDCKHTPFLVHDNNIPWMERSDPKANLLFPSWYKEEDDIYGQGNNPGISARIRRILWSMGDRDLWRQYLADLPEEPVASKQDLPEEKTSGNSPAMPAEATMPMGTPTPSDPAPAAKSPHPTVKVDPGLAVPAANPAGSPREQTAGRRLASATASFADSPRQPHHRRLGVMEAFGGVPGCA